jgi:hypothetical protein
MQESIHCNTIATYPLTSLSRAGRYKSFLPTTKQPSQATRTHLQSHRTTSGSGKWSLGTTSEGIATTQASEALGRVIDGASICRWREDEPRTPPTTLGHGSMALLTTANAPLEPLAGRPLRFQAALLLSR